MTDTAHALGVLFAAALLAGSGVVLRQWLGANGVGPTTAKALAAAWAGASLLGVVGFWSYEPTSLDSDAAVVALAALVGLVVVGSVVVALGARGRRRIVLGVGVTLLGVVAVAGFVVFVNGFLDVSAADSSTVRVVNKHERWKSGSLWPDYYLAVEDRRRLAAPRTLRVSRAVYAAAQPGRDHLHVTMRAGWLGWPWIEDVRVMTPSDTALRVEALTREIANQLERREWRAAIGGLRTLLELTPDNGWAYHARGASYSQLGDHGNALTDLAAACRLGFARGCEDHARLSRRSR